MKWSNYKQQHIEEGPHNRQNPTVITRPHSDHKLSSYLRDRIPKKGGSTELTKTPPGSSEILTSPSLRLG